MFVMDEREREREREGYKPWKISSMQILNTSLATMPLGPGLSSSIVLGLSQTPTDS